jgi:regulatory protein
MAGRRGARSGRGWDAIPPRAGAGMAAGDDAAEPRRAFGRRGRRGGGELPDGGDPNHGGSPHGDGEVPHSGGVSWSSDDGSRADRDGRTRDRGRDEPPRSESEVAREICLRQLAVRPRTRAELAKALLRKEISEEVIAEVLDRYDEVGIIDDAAFARAWVSSRHHGRGLARRALANELRQRGVDPEVAGEALEAVDDEAEAETARALVDRKLRTASGTPDAIFRRLVAMLARKGYPAGVAIRAVKDALAARDAEAAEFAEALDADALTDEASGLES